MAHVTFSRVIDCGDARRFDVIVNGIVLGECARYVECFEWCADNAIESAWAACPDEDAKWDGYIHGETHARSLQARLRRSLNWMDADAIATARNC